MLFVCGCYTCTSSADKHSVSVHKLSVNTFTFIMSASLSVFIALTLPFGEHTFRLCPETAVGVLLLAGCKILETTMSVLVLRELSAFEVKAWLGITLFASYFTDVFFGVDFALLKLSAISITVIGLVLIASSGREEKINYRRIVVPLFLYLLSKYGYALVMRAFSAYASSSVLLLSALVAVALIYLPFVDFSEFGKKLRGCIQTALMRIPNTAGILAENAVIAISMTNYSFIQPLILVSLFFIRVIKRERFAKKNLFGSILCIAGLAAFQLL